MYGDQVIDKVCGVCEEDETAEHFILYCKGFTLQRLKKYWVRKDAP